MRDGEEHWYKFIFVLNFHALTAMPTLAFSHSDVTHRRYPDDIFFLLSFISSRSYVFSSANTRDILIVGTDFELFPESKIATERT